MNLINRLILFVGKELRASHGACLFRPKFYSGLSRRSEQIFDRTRNDAHNYLSDWSRLKIKCNGQYRIILDDKFVFDRAFGGMLRLPEIYGTIVEGRYASQRASGISSRKPQDSFDELLVKEGTLVVKTVRGHSGRTVWILRASEGGSYSVNGHEEARHDFWERMKAMSVPLIVTRFARTGGFASAFYPDSSNTIRIITIHDQEGPFVAGAVQRIGNRKSRPLDDFIQGGLSAWIFDDGTLSSAATYSAERGVEWFSNHPETGQRIEGVTVPDWNSMTEEILDAARAFPILPIIGWDIMQTDEGMVVIEGNNVPGLHSMQVHQPFLKKPRVRRFFEREGIIRSGEVTSELETPQTRQAF